MTATHTSLRIRKLILKGLEPNAIARKIGRPNDVQRIIDEGLSIHQHLCEVCNPIRS